MMDRGRTFLHYFKKNFGSYSVTDVKLGDILSDVCMLCTDNPMKVLVKKIFMINISNQSINNLQRECSQSLYSYMYNYVMVLLIKNVFKSQFNMNGQYSIAVCGSPQAIL